MRNIRLTMEYDGSRYDGWQSRTGRSSSLAVKDKLEAVLEKMEGEAVEVIGAAKTGGGEHALLQTANFKTNSAMSLLEIKRYLNRFLPMDIAVLGAFEAPERFHAAYHAKGFRYEYRVTMGEVPSVFERKYSFYSFKRLSLERMREAAVCLTGKHDFRAFCDNKKMKKSTEREMRNVEIDGKEEGLVISMEADDFWPHMARIIAGTLLEIGKGELEPEIIPLLFKEGDREKAGPTAEPRGLFLKEVLY